MRIITPFPAGAGPEAVLRVLAEKLQKKWGQPVIVENKPGANGFIAIDAFKRGATDGHDLIQLDNVHLAAYPHLFKKLPYDAAQGLRADRAAVPHLLLRRRAGRTASTRRWATSSPTPRPTRAS